MFNGVQWIFMVLFPHTKKQLPTPGLFQGFPDLSVTGTVAALCLMRWQQPWVDHWDNWDLGQEMPSWELGKKLVHICPLKKSDLCDFAIA